MLPPEQMAGDEGAQHESADGRALLPYLYPIGDTHANKRSIKLVAETVPPADLWD
jgi:hypothetical protein